MQPFPNTPIGKLSDAINSGTIVLDRNKMIDPNLLNALFPPTCASTFDDHFSTLGKQPVAATLTILPNNNDALNYPAVGDTAVTFKAADAALTTELTSWSSTVAVPKFTKAYARFSKVSLFGDPEYDGILCIVKANQKVHRLFLHLPTGEHVWYVDFTMSYCKKGKLYLLTNEQCTMSIDFGL